VKRHPKRKSRADWDELLKDRVANGEEDLLLPDGLKNHFDGEEWPW